MPKIIAAAVIRIARSRLPAPSRAASRTGLFSCRARSAKVTSRIEFATAMPIAMIAPMNDWMLSVVCVTSSISSTPQSTAGTVRTTASASRIDWKFADSSRKITTTASSSPIRNPEMVCSNGGICAAHHDGHAARRRAGVGQRLIQLWRRFAQSDPVNIRSEADDVLAVVAFNLPGMVPSFSCAMFVEQRLSRWPSSITGTFADLLQRFASGSAAAPPESGTRCRSSDRANSSDR